jgi:hypothetical protein
MACRVCGSLRVIGGAAVLGVALSNHADPLAAQVEPKLEMHQLAAIPSPPSFLPLGAEFTDSVTTLLWGKDGFLLIANSGSTRWVAFQGEPDPRGMRIVEFEPLIVEVVDARSNAVVRYDKAGRSLGAVLVGLDDRILQAVAVRATWLIYTASDTTPRRLWLKTGSGTPEMIWESQREISRTSTAFRPDSTAGLRLSAGTDAAYVGELKAPFRTWRIVPDVATESGFTLLGGSSDAVLQAVTKELDTDQTVALPFIPLDRGYLQQLADLTEDRRLVALLDANGSFVRSSLWTVAMGIVAGDRGTRRIIAFRDIGVQEIVLYRWGWSAHDQDR